MEECPYAGKEKTMSRAALEAEIEKARKAVRVLELKVEHMTGKLVNEA